jgi:C-terminal processing protease CtpA/Prc
VFVFSACLLTLLTAGESSLVEQVLMLSKGLATRIAFLEVSTTEMLEKLDNKMNTITEKLSTETKEENKVLDKKIDAKTDRLDERIDTILKKFEAICDSNTERDKKVEDRFSWHCLWLVVVTIIWGMLNFKGALGWFK